MANNVAASMKASIVIDKKELISSALSAYAEAQKELDGNKIELLVDVSDDKALKKLKEIQKELVGKEYILKFKNQGTDEILESLDVLEKRLKDIFSGKAFGSGTGKGIGNSIVDEKSLQSVLDLFTKMESHLGEMKRVFADVGDGEEFSPLLKMINSVQESVKELNKSVSDIKLNVNMDLGSEINERLNAKIAETNSRQLEAYRKLFASMKDTKKTNKEMVQFFEPEDASVTDIIGAYKSMIERAEKQFATSYKKNGRTVKSNIYKDMLGEDYKHELELARDAFNRATNKKNSTSPLGELFQKTDLTEVINQLTLIVDKLGEISVSALEFKNVFSEGFNVSSSVEEIEKLTSRVKELEEELSKVKLPHTTSPVETNISSPIKDTFQGVDKPSTEASSNSIKEETKAMEQVAEKSKEAANAKDKFTQVNKEVKNSAETSSKAVQKEENAFGNLNKVIDKYNSKLTSISRKPIEENRSVEFQNHINTISNSIKELEMLRDKTNAENYIFDEKDVSLGNELKTIIDDNIDAISRMSAAEKGSTENSRRKEIDKITKYLKENTGISKEARLQLQNYLNLLRNGKGHVNVEKIHNAFLELTESERLAGREGKRFLDILSDKRLYGLAGQLASYFSFYDLVNLGRDGITVIRELDTALTEMRKVSDETVTSLERFQDVSFDLADDVGTTAKQIQESTASWMRLGEAMSEANESAQVSNILLNVSEFEGIDEATESLVAMSQAYKDLEKIEIVDVLNKIGNEYSISTDGIATALQNSASALVTANNDLNSAVSLIVAGNAITQDPSKTGAGIRTIALRLVGTKEAKAELEELGEDVSDMVMTSSKVRETIINATKAASKDGMGFDILDDNGNYKSTYEIMQGLADLYDDIVAKDKELGTNNLNLLLETISGKNRANIAASILQNGEMLKSVYEDTKNASGSAQEELDKYLESIDGRMQKFSNQAQEFWYKLIDSDTIKGGITLLTELLELLTNITGFSGMSGIIGATVGVVLNKKLG